MRKSMGIKGHSKGLIVLVALVTIAGTVGLQATSASAVPPTWPSDVWAIGNFNGVAGNFGNTTNPGTNPQNNTNNSVATIQAAVNAAEAWGRAHTPTSGTDAGNTPDTFVLLAPGHAGTESLKGEIREHVKRHLAPYQQPREIEFVTELPMTTTGKVQRKVLREREERSREG